MVDDQKAFQDGGGELRRPAETAAHCPAEGVWAKDGAVSLPLLSGRGRPANQNREGTKVRFSGSELWHQVSECEFFFSCIQFITHVFPSTGVWSFLTSNLVLLVDTSMAGWFDL